ncbi:MAG: hypothetical protein GY934_09735 [Gammaproteobacteria bacterium]|nr:hypothetical protein [Gammaproteobacteria bacterium]
MAIKIIVVMAIMVYLWTDGKALLISLVVGIAWVILCAYMVGVVAVLLGSVLGIIVVGPVARLVFRKNTDSWSGVICKWLSSKAFGWMDILGGWQDKKIEALEKQRAELITPPEAPPDGMYKTRYSDTTPTQAMCPDCDGKLRAAAGGSMNVKCDACGALFNYTGFDGMLERMNHESS